MNLEIGSMEKHFLWIGILGCPPGRDYFHVTISLFGYYCSVGVSGMNGEGNLGLFLHAFIHRRFAEWWQRSVIFDKEIVLR